MRHRKRRGKLKVSMAHHRAMRRNLVSSLFEHGSITTTVAKAKAFQPLAEKLITLARRGIRSKGEGTPEGVAAHLHAVRRGQHQHHSRNSGCCKIHEERLQCSQLVLCRQAKIPDLEWTDLIE